MVDPNGMKKTSVYRDGFQQSDEASAKMIEAFREKWQWRLYKVGAKEETLKGK